MAARRSVRFTNYRRQVEAEIAASPQVGAVLAGNARAIYDRVPRYMPGRRRSRPFVNRMYVTAEPGKARVGTTWKLAHIIEWGSINNPPYAPLRRATRSSGLRFRELGKGGQPRP